MASAGWAMTTFDRTTATGFERTSTFEGYKSMESQNQQGANVSSELSILAGNFLVQLRGYWDPRPGNILSHDPNCAWLTGADHPDGKAFRHCGGCWRLIGKGQDHGRESPKCRSRRVNPGPIRCQSGSLATVRSRQRPFFANLVHRQR
jgi:hypothetical protein